jgi:hypothetical protein
MNLVAEWITMSAPHSDRPAQVRGRERVIHDERQFVLMRDRRDRLDVEHVARGVADRLAEERLRGGADGLSPRVDVVGVDPGQVHVHLAQQVFELVDRATVESRGRHHVSPGCSRVNSAAACAAIPLAKATAPQPPSRLATRSSNTATVDS